MFHGAVDIEHIVSVVGSASIAIAQVFPELLLELTVAVDLLPPTIKLVGVVLVDVVVVVGDFNVVAFLLFHYLATLIIQHTLFSESIHTC